MTKESNGEISRDLSCNPNHDLKPVFDILRQIEDLNINLQKEFESEAKLILDKFLADK